MISQKVNYRGNNGGTLQHVHTKGTKFSMQTGLSGLGHSASHTKEI